MNWWTNSLKSFVMVKPLTLLFILTVLEKLHIELKKIFMNF